MLIDATLGMKGRGRRGGEERRGEGRESANKVIE